MSTEVSHKPYEVEAWPPTAITPEILYLHVGQDVPAVAYANAGRWECLVFGAEDGPVVVASEQVAREWLTAYGWEVAA